MCKYCEGEVENIPNLITDECSGCDLEYNVYIGGNRIHSDFDSIEINYCPICGRKIDEED